MTESQPGPPARVDIPEILGNAYAAFKRLQDWGCGEDLKAAVLFIYLASVPSMRGEGRRLEFRRADSHELLLNGDTRRSARNRIKQARAGLDKYRKALEALKGRIWQRTNVNHVYKDQAMGYLYGCLDALSDALDRTGPKAHPDITRAITRMVLFVRDKTGQYHDAEVAEVIAAAIGEPAPRGYPRFEDAESLKTWRMKYGLHNGPDGKPKIQES